MCCYVLGLLICTRKACLIKCSTDVERNELKFELAQFSLKPTSLMPDMENLLLNIYSHLNEKMETL